MTEIKKQFETVIGLEVHLQLNTKTKIFCGCPNIFGEEPNTQTCPVCLGLPGTLPVLNKQVLLHAIKTGLSLKCKINPYIKFDRKNYYYPDLPKGYQITQFDFPVAQNGYIEILDKNDASKKIRINRAHIEEDAGKLIHDTSGNCSLVDYNRTGTPLLEIVSEPDIRSPKEAYDYLQKLKLTIKYLDVSDCDMEKGSLRCDANVSIREKGETQLGVKSELKNLNSFKAVKAGLEFEVERQRKTLLSRGALTQETRLWDEKKGITYPMRTKEGSHDYRYFPEPDLIPFVIEQEKINSVQESIPELPAEKVKRFMSQYDLLEYDANILIQQKDIAAFFEECAKKCTHIKKICNWIIGSLLQELNAKKTTITDIKLKPEDLISIIEKTEQGTLSNLAAKKIFKVILETGKNIEEIIEERGLTQVSDNSTLEDLADEIIAENKKAVIQFKEGKENALGFLIGQAMKKTKGKANPKMIGEIIKRRITHA